MKSVLIKDTTKSERIAIIKEWIPVDDGLEDCEIDMWEMYRDYINGEKEIVQINEEFSKRSHCLISKVNYYGLMMVKKNGT